MKRYKGKIFFIEAKENEKYVGVATNALEDVMLMHKYYYKLWKAKKNHWYSLVYKLFEKYGEEECKIEEKEKVECGTFEELLEIEKKWIEKTDCINKGVDDLAGISTEDVKMNRDEYWKIDGREREYIKEEPPIDMYVNHRDVTSVVNGMVSMYDELKNKKIIPERVCKEMSVGRKIERRDEIKKMLGVTYFGTVLHKIITYLLDKKKPSPISYMTSEYYKMKVEKYKEIASEEGCKYIEGLEKIREGEEMAEYLMPGLVESVFRLKNRLKRKRLCSYVGKFEKERELGGIIALNVVMYNEKYMLYGKPDIMCENGIIDIKTGEKKTGKENDKTSNLQLLLFALLSQQTTYCFYDPYSGILRLIEITREELDTFGEYVREYIKNGMKKKMPVKKVPIDRKVVFNEEEQKILENADNMINTVKNFFE